MNKTLLLESPKVAGQERRFVTKTLCTIGLLSCVISCVRAPADGFWFEELLSYQLPENNAIDAGIAGGVDLLYEIAPFAEIGLGAQIQFGSQTLYEGNFGFDDLFLSLRFPIQTVFITFYPLCRVGYGLFFGDADFRGSGTLPGGLYYAFGAGCRSPDLEYTFLGHEFRVHVFLEGAYESNSGLESGVYVAWNLSLGLGVQLNPASHPQ